MRRVSFWSRLTDLIVPRSCGACGARLTESEQVLCARCNLHLPRTGYASNAYDNEMATLFWGRIAIERCAAWFFYQAASQSSRIIYELKYNDRPEYAHQLGMTMASELLSTGFFDGIDLIIPIPLTRRRQRQRGYNQSIEIAQGIHETTGIHVNSRIVTRTSFTGSQTQKDRWQRADNVEGVFRLRQAEAVQGRHVLIVDDVVTTGATICSCASEIAKAGDVRFSVLALGFSKS